MDLTLDPSLVQQVVIAQLQAQETVARLNGNEARADVLRAKHELVTTMMALSAAMTRHRRTALDPTRTEV